ncbi:hypothetical protein THAOC_20573 [Thalassiosira oceanica]|uniref:Uncharacterized protein n=1 Tax=Thalassiosira oceanica TaxID=159749 RepID=K0RZL4_THAOC|nr:hypothetical protein THAOC_20573 [Thalassiosira oceanica]|eukprot:EJK59233.1 hypothetical protein THAOC_20573 [Thalassiosira oceanica]
MTYACLRLLPEKSIDFVKAITRHAFLIELQKGPVTSVNSVEELNVAIRLVWREETPGQPLSWLMVFKQVDRNSNTLTSVPNGAEPVGTEATTGHPAFSVLSLSYTMWLPIAKPAGVDLAAGKHR